MITLRPYRDDDANALLRLFYDTVHSVNSEHYSSEQLNAWVSSPDQNVEGWAKRFAKEKTIVALFRDKIAGFGNLGNGPSIGMLYVHMDYQRNGIATEILKTLEQMLKEAGMKVSAVQASITAKPFFERQGYRCVRDNRKTVNGIELLNFIMEKQLS